MKINHHKNLVLPLYVIAKAKIKMCMVFVTLKNKIGEVVWYFFKLFCFENTIRGALQMCRVAINLYNVHYCALSASSLDNLSQIIA